MTLQGEYDAQLGLIRKQGFNVKQTLSYTYKARLRLGLSHFHVAHFQFSFFKTIELCV